MEDDEKQWPQDQDVSGTAEEDANEASQMHAFERVDQDGNEQVAPDAEKALEVDNDIMSAVRPENVCVGSVAAVQCVASMAIFNKVVPGATH